MKRNFWAASLSVILLLATHGAALAGGNRDPGDAAVPYSDKLAGSKSSPRAVTNPQMVAPPKTTVPMATLPGIGQAVADLSSRFSRTALAVDWAGLRAFYDAGQPPIWVTQNGFSPLGVQIAEQLPQALQAGMKVPPEIGQAVSNLTPPSDPTTAAATEALLSVAFIAGAVDANSILGDNDQHGVGILAALGKAKDQAAFLQRELPGFAPFWRLYYQMPTYIGYMQSGGWPTIDDSGKLEPGQSDARIPIIRQRLAITGELASATSDKLQFYDPLLTQAMEVFQRNHGLNDDGVIGKRSFEELNVSAETRLRMILLNLRRMQEQGPTFGPHYLIANVPAQEVKIIEDGRLAFYTKAIVGRVDRKTPLLTSIITQVKLNPDWSVPQKIAASDMLRHELESPGYFATKNVRVYDTSGTEINPTSIDWREVRRSGLFPYRLRQDAGPENALGPVKLDFKNDYAVYLHGTSAPALFAKQDRYLSSGCVRTADPLGLTTFLLKENPAWTRDHVDQVVASGKTTYVSLPRPMPIHITYMTAWVDETGVMQFRRDAYGYDRLPTLSGISMPTVGTSQLSEATPPQRIERNSGKE
ncbi:murein L,D-transpeptidase [Dongia soli]|uniref:L,D-transpeptidase family protein n=1 Tax=Dongia soli TaxID=600628 RepID=A0ABU5EEA9_9PROT|nr:L,D-transpeptidase family protein [Dongia soli]MDY0884169.1 L,D-transpeptidase family protein [Dongia soli]